MTKLPTQTTSRSPARYGKKESPARKEIFLKSLASGASVAKSAAAADITRTCAFEWKKNDPVFRAAWEEAMAAGVDILEDEAFRRAVTGVERPVFYQGDVCGHVTEYSDTLLVVMLKGKRPEVYADREGQGGGGATVNILLTGPDTRL